jgi:predicted membrane GTPase involved in stress response
LQVRIVFDFACEFDYQETGKVMEPVEETVVDVDESYAGTVIEKISLRKGELVEYKAAVADRVRLTFMLPSRGMIRLRHYTHTCPSPYTILIHVPHHPLYSYMSLTIHSTHPCP